MRTLSGLLVVVAAVLCACDSSSSADAYVGTWHRVKYPNETVTVTAQGGGRLSFVAKDYTAGEPVIGVFTKDMVTTGAGSSLASLQSNGSLIYDGREYKK